MSHYIARSASDVIKTGGRPGPVQGLFVGGGGGGGGDLCKLLMTFNPALLVCSVIRVDSSEAQRRTSQDRL